MTQSSQFNKDLPISLQFNLHLSSEKVKISIVSFNTLVSLSYFLSPLIFWSAWQRKSLSFSLYCYLLQQTRAQPPKFTITWLCRRSSCFFSCEYNVGIHMGGERLQPQILLDDSVRNIAMETAKNSTDLLLLPYLLSSSNSFLIVPRSTQHLRSLNPSSSSKSSPYVTKSQSKFLLASFRC